MTRLLYGSKNDINKQKQTHSIYKLHELLDLILEDGNKLALTFSS